jgi:hypothetical protein
MEINRNSLFQPAIVGAKLGAKMTGFAVGGVLKVASDIPASLLRTVDSRRLGIHLEENRVAHNITGMRREIVARQHDLEVLDLNVVRHVAESAKDSPDVDVYGPEEIEPFVQEIEEFMDEQGIKDKTIIVAGFMARIVVPSFINHDIRPK